MYAVRDLSYYHLLSRLQGGRTDLRARICLLNSLCLSQGEWHFTHERRCIEYQSFISCNHTIFPIFALTIIQWNDKHGHLCADADKYISSIDCILHHIFVIIVNIGNNECNHGLCCCWEDYNIIWRINNIVKRRGLVPGVRTYVFN